MVSMCKSYEVDNSLTLGYGSDEDLFEDSTVTETSPDTSRDEEAALTKIQRVVQQLRFVLTGIPPPPSFTIPQLDVDEMLKLWTANQQFVVNGQLKSPDGQVTSTSQSELRLAESGKWPEVTQSHYFAVNYNLGRLCEEVERLQARVQERFVGCETSSCVNSLAGQQTVPLTASAKKRARTRGRSWGQQSPGRRLSYLARRRHTFSSANLIQSSKAGQGGGGCTSDKRQIVLALNRKTANRLKLRKESKKTQSMVASAKRPSSNEHKVTYPKRALFQSPHEKKRTPFGKVKPSPNTLRIQQSKHSLRHNDQVAAKLVSPPEKLNENGKRKKMSPAGSMTTPRKKCYRSLSFSEGNSAIEKPPQHQGTRSTVLGKTHTHKMLWAVSNALRDKGIKREHQYFRQWASELFKLCSRLWLSSGGDLTRQGSTSENMLTLANQFVNDIVARAGRGGSGHRTAAAPSADVSNQLASAEEKPATVSKSITFDKQCGISNPILIINGISTTTTKNSEQSEPCFKVPLNESDSLSNLTNMQSKDVECCSSIVHTVENSLELGVGHVSNSTLISHITNKEAGAGFRFVKFGSQSSASDQENCSPSTSRTVAQGTSDSLKLELLNESQFIVAPGDKRECLSEMISQWRRLVPSRQEGIDDVCSTYSDSQVTAAKFGLSSSSWSDDGDESCMPFVAPELFDILDTSVSTDLSCCSAVSEATQSSSRHTN